MDDPNMTMEEYIKLEEEKARRRRRVFNWKTATYGKIRVNDDLYDLRYVETEFPAIVIDDACELQDALSCKSQVSTPVNDEIDFRISFDESDDEDYTIICDKNSFSYKMISVNNLKTDSENDNEKVMPSIPSPEPAIYLLTEPILNPRHIDEFNLNDETSLSEYDEEEQNILYFNNLFPFNVIHPNDLKSDEENDNNEIDIIQSSEGNGIIHGSSVLSETSHVKAEKTVPVAEGSSETTTKRKDNDINSTVDACVPNALNCGKPLKGMKQGESSMLRSSETNLYWESQQSTRNREKAIVTSIAPTYDPEPATVTEDEEMSKEKEIDKLMALISLSINKGTGYDNQRAVNVAGARENVGTPVVQKSGIQCYNCKEYGHVSRECQKLKRVKDAAYHKEKMLLCKQEEAGVTPDPVDNSRPIFDDEPMHKVKINIENYNVFAMENEHSEQPESSNDIYLTEQGDTNITIDSLDICYDRAQDDQDETDDLD
ncbi:retrovirus-related pol polyprotein from transposon TNT 1-94 [Tanacetum coccineum]